MRSAAISLVLLGSLNAAGQSGVQKGEPVPAYRMTVVGRMARVIKYRHLIGSTQIDFRGTALLPQAYGTAEVASKTDPLDINAASKTDSLDINAKFKDLQPASKFGPEYLTYVLWAITLEGRAVNLGEVLLNGTKSKLKVTSDLQAFGLIVTAEPYFAVSKPSDLVVMENEVGKIEGVETKYELLPRGQYIVNVDPAEVHPMVVDSKVPLELYEARNAVQIARWAGADRYAPDTLKMAMELLRQAEDYRAREGRRKPVVTEAREAVQTAEDARVLAIKRMDQERAARNRRS